MKCPPPPHLLLPWANSPKGKGRGKGIGQWRDSRLTLKSALLLIRSFRGSYSLSRRIRMHYSLFFLPDFFFGIICYIVTQTLKGNRGVFVCVCVCVWAGVWVLVCLSRLKRWQQGKQMAIKSKHTQKQKLRPSRVETCVQGRSQLCECVWGGFLRK